VPNLKNKLKTLIIRYLKVFIILSCSFSDSLCARADSLSKFAPLPPEGGVKSEMEKQNEYTSYKKQYLKNIIRLDLNGKFTHLPSKRGVTG